MTEMTLIERLDLNGVSTLTSGTIPGTYRHLVLMGSLRSARAAVDNSDARFRFNGDTAANYQFQRLSGTNTTAVAQISQAQTFFMFLDIPAATSGAGFCSTFRCDIPAYAATTFQKHGQWITGYHRNTGVSGQTILTAGFAWANTAAITSITAFEGNTQNFAAGSFVDIYGVV